MPAVGKRLADKIWEIVNSGHLRRLDHIDEKQAVIDMFGKIWGAGPTCAQRFVALVCCSFVCVFVCLIIRILTSDATVLPCS